MSIMKGSIRECFAHLADSPGFATDQERRRALCDFVRVTNPTVRRWLNGSMPIGEPLLRLQCYLALLGYEVSEFSRISETLQDTLWAFAFGLLSMDDIAAAVDYVGEQGRNSVFRVLQGKHEPFPSTQRLFEKLMQQPALGEEGLTLQQLVRALRNERGQCAPRTPAAPPAPPRPRLATAHKSPHAAVITTFAGLVQVMTPLAKILESDECSAEERTLVREISGGKNIFILANSLFRLCGERSREMHQHSANTR